MNLSKKIIILGPAHPLRGGIAIFNERLARQFQNEGHDVTIYSFSLQYPDFLFPGTTQYSSEPAPADLNIITKINSINPLNWMVVGNEIKNLKPDLVVRSFVPAMLARGRPAHVVNTASLAGLISSPMMAPSTAPISFPYQPIVSLTVGEYACKTAVPRQPRMVAADRGLLPNPGIPAWPA